MEEDLKKKKTCHETFGLLQVGQYPLILLESKRSVSHCHSVLVADALSQMPFKPHQSVVFSGTKLLLSFSFTKRVSGQQTLSVHSFLYAVRTCCLSGTPLDKPCFCA